MNSPDGELFPYRSARSYPTPDTSSGKPFVIMYHGSLVERNGLDVAVDALAKVRDRVPTAELRVFGTKSPYLEIVLQSASDRGLQKAVRYLGPKRLEDLVAEIEQCDVGVIPNHRNAFTEINTPTRIFEYLALGKPVIAPRTAGIIDYFDPKSLFFFEPGNSNELAEQIAYVSAHRDDAIEVAERGQQVYLAHTWFRERQTFVDLVSGLLSEDHSSVSSTS
jgi:glycosyltransferase involved in cell wall biosynthesis